MSDVPERLCSIKKSLKTTFIGRKNYGYRGNKGSCKQQEV